MNNTYLPKHHAILYSTVVKHLLAELGENASDDVRAITQAYGKDRAERMAKRALHDGLELNALSYLSYGELNVPSGIIERRTSLDGTDAVQITTKCPWHDAWEQEGHLEYGRLFCEVFDEALADGFHRSVNMKVPVTITTGDTHCKFVFLNSNFTEDDKRILALNNERLNKSATKPFLYHMGHLFSFMSKELNRRYGELAKQIIDKALDEYSSTFGSEAVCDILSMADIDYSSIADYEGK